MKKTISLLLTAALAMVSCNSALEESYNKQESRIEQFINSQSQSHEGMEVVHNNGSHRLVLTPGEGEALEYKGNIAFYYAGYTFSGNMPGSSNMFTTNKLEVATAAKWNISEDECKPFVTELNDKDLIQGLYNGLKGVKAGEECYIVFSGKYGFGNRNFGTVPANSALCYHIWVETISND